MSVSPAQNCAKPSPVPGPATEMATSAFSAANLSALPAEIGSTVDEPEIVIEFDAPLLVPPSPPPHAAMTIAKATSGATRRHDCNMAAASSWLCAGSKVRATV